MSTASTSPAPLRGHIVSFPKAIPSADWLANRMLWADHLGAVWPMGRPTPASREEETSLAHLRAYTAEGFFTPCRVPLERERVLVRELKTALGLPESKLGIWLKSVATTAFDKVNPDAALPGGPGDPNRTFYLDKFPPQVTQLLLTSGVAERDSESGFMTIRNANQADVLVAALANVAVPSGHVGLPLTLDTNDDAALARAATPAPRGTSRPAMAIDLPVLEGAAKDLDPESVLEFRLKDRNEKARLDYLNEVERYVERVFASSPGDAPGAAAERVSRDLGLASKSLWQKATTANAGGVALSVMSMVIPIPHPEGVASWVGLGAGVGSVGLSTVTAIRGTHVHSYLRSARKAGLLAPS